MKNIFLMLWVSVSFMSSVEADVCHTQKVKAGNKEVEFFRIEDTPEDRAQAKPKMMVSGIYQFVPRKNANGWNVYRCAKENITPPVYDANNCKLKNDFQYGSFVAKSAHGTNLQKVSNRGVNNLGVTMPYAMDLPEYHVDFNGDEIKVKQYTHDNNYSNAPEVVTCSYSEKSSAPSVKKSTGGNSSPAGKVGNSN